MIVVAAIVLGGLYFFCTRLEVRDPNKDDK